MLLMDDPHIHESISYTTRAPRKDEHDGQDYKFVSQDHFKKLLCNDGILEHAEIMGNYYGTPKTIVEDYLKKGQDVIFCVNWQGFEQIVSTYPEDTVGVFILPPSKQILHSRLKKRMNRNSRNERADRKKSGDCR